MKKVLFLFLNAIIVLFLVFNWVPGVIYWIFGVRIPIPRIELGNVWMGAAIFLLFFILPTLSFLCYKFRNISMVVRVLAYVYPLAWISVVAMLIFHFKNIQ
jgi:hypothetical protein